MLKRIVLLLLLGTVVASCSSSTNPGVSSVFVQPRAGSTFIYDYYNTDTATGQVILGSRDTSVDTVLQTGMTFMGKTNVSMISSTSRKSHEISYINYEPNNDISAFILVSLSSAKWLTFPFGSKTTSTTIISDTSVTFFDTTTATKIMITESYVDDEVITVKGQPLSVTKLKQAISTTQTVTPPGLTNTQTQLSFGYFAPSLGYLAKSETPVSIDPTIGMKSSGSLQTLIDYILK